MVGRWQRVEIMEIAPGDHLSHTAFIAGAVQTPAHPDQSRGHVQSLHGR